MDRRGANLALLATLDVLLAERGVTAAARRLSVSQPALSARLAKLRRLLDDPLLVGDAHGMAPTPRALALEAPLRDLLGRLDALLREQQPFDPARAERTFRIAATDYAHAVVVAPLIAALARSAPGLRIAGVPFGAGTERALAEDVDLAVTSERMTPERLPSRRLFEERFVAVWRKSHPTARAPISLDAFCALEHVLVSPEGGGFAGAVDEALAALGRGRRVVASLPSFLLAPQIVRASDRIAVVPERLVRLDPQGLVLTSPPVDLPSFRVVASWHPRLAYDSGHAWLRRELVSSHSAGDHGEEVP